MWESEYLVQCGGARVGLKRHHGLGLRLGEPQRGQVRQFQHRHGQVSEPVAAHVDDAQPRQLADLSPVSRIEISLTNH